jgi:hypothetical protein
MRRRVPFFPLIPILPISFLLAEAVAIAILFRKVRALAVAERR